MQKATISNVESFLICGLLLLTNVYSVMSGGTAGADAWICHIIATIAATAVAWAFAYVCDAHPQKSFCEILRIAFGNAAGRALAVFFVVLSLMTCIVSQTVFTRFVQISALARTPQIVLPFLVSVLAALSLRRGISSIAGTARLLSVFAVLVFLLFVALGVNRTEIAVIFPLFKNFERLPAGTGEVFLNRFGSIPALMSVYTRINYENRSRKGFCFSVFSSGIVITIICLITLTTLGAETARLVFYPVYSAMSVKSVGGFVQHTELLACISMTLSLFFKTAVCIIFADDVLSDVFKTTRDKGVCMPLALFVCAATALIYRDLSSLRAMVEWRTPAAFVVALEVILPLLLVSVIYIKKKRKL